MAGRPQAHPGAEGLSLQAMIAWECRTCRRKRTHRLHGPAGVPVARRADPNILFKSNDTLH